MSKEGFGSGAEEASVRRGAAEPDTEERIRGPHSIGIRESGAHPVITPPGAVLTEPAPSPVPLLIHEIPPGRMEEIRHLNDRVDASLRMTGSFREQIFALRMQEERVLLELRRVRDAADRVLELARKDSGCPDGRPATLLLEEGVFVEAPGDVPLEALKEYVALTRSK